MSAQRPEMGPRIIKTTSKLSFSLPDVGPCDLCGADGPCAHKLAQQKLRALLGDEGLPPAYIDAIRTASLPTASFTMRHADRPRTPATPTHTFRPPAIQGSRSRLREFKSRRKRAGPASNSAPGASEGEDLWLHGEQREQLPRIARAVDDFNARHRVRSRSTTALLNAVSFDPTSARISGTFDDGLWDMRRNRFFLDDPSLHSSRLDDADDAINGGGEGGGRGRKGSTAKRVVRRSGKRFSLDDSVWAPRKNGGNSRDYYETSASIASLFDADCMPHPKP